MQLTTVQTVKSENKKDNQHETLIFEMTAYAIILGATYLILKIIF